ncbi:SDR family oxidoreductase [Azospirillum sp. YIM B02556]|uniref:SDR family oxidoreductase n=1 Tax=Azospirillum endophyticum TaxID=2800326 RepID=A0ABS1F410_9PROT|nr:SDR family oxidoreductase [Azospirillum endophyticum]MBK1838166.1 SDR family oxidoreductase [Azospirillum endophyticum]
MAKWTASDIPPQEGRTAIVTGTGGLGFESALALARAGAGVVIAGRNPDKGEAAVARIRTETPSARVRFERLDLANLESIAEFGHRLQGQQDSLDLLVNNAGVMMPPNRRETADGFELQLGTNHLGHFALTAALMPILRKGGARVVSLSSLAARGGAIDFDDLNAERSYRPMAVYSRSKLACLMFAFELQRRSEANGWGLSSVAAHPGIARTDLLHNAPGRWSPSGIARSLLWFLFQPAAQGALPTLFAATAPEAKPGVYYGPDRLSETRGHPSEARVPAQARDPSVSARLWEVSQQLTGFAF